MEVPRWFKFFEGSRGIKQSMTETYIDWYINQGGRLINNLKAKIIKQKKDYWIVSCLQNNKKTNIKAKYVFLCGGAISTPFLLRSSNIKNNIGNTLQMHPTIKVLAEFGEKVNYQNMGVPIHQVREFSPDISIGCSISSKPYLALSLLENDKFLDRVNQHWEKMAIYYAMIRPVGVGKIRKLPFFGDPLVTYDLKAPDLALLSKALKKMCTILFNAKALKLYPSIKNYGIIKNLSDINSIPDKLSKKNINLMTIHLFSSCPMGENKNICAADSFGKVFGYDNLYINDGSLMPSAPGVNPQGTIMAIARRNIHNFLRNL